MEYVSRGTQSESIWHNVLYSKATGKLSPDKLGRSWLYTTGTLASPGVTSGNITEGGEVSKQVC